MNNKKIYIIITILLLAVFFLFVLNSVSYAEIPTSSISINQAAKSQLAGPGNKLLGVIRIVVTFIAFAGAMVLGYRYMVSSIDEKVKAKDALVMYLIGIVLAFGTIRLVTIVSNLLA